MLYEVITWLLEIKPEGKLLCQYGVAIDDVMPLMSDGTPEDLGTDEIAKQAKFFIQPAVSKFRPLLLQAYLICLGLIV